MVAVITSWWWVVILPLNVHTTSNKHLTKWGTFFVVELVSNQFFQKFHSKITKRELLLGYIPNWPRHVVCCRILKGMVHSWLHEVSTYGNLNADAQLMHFYRYGYEKEDTVYNNKANCSIVGDCWFLWFKLTTLLWKMGHLDHLTHKSG